MSCQYIQTENRKYPLNQPKDWRVRFPRYMAELPEHIQDIAVTYIGVQPRNQDSPKLGDHDKLEPHATNPSQEAVSNEIEAWIRTGSQPSSPALWEKFYVEAGYDTPDTEVFVVYWFDKAAAQSALEAFSIRKMMDILSPEDKPKVGLWRESYIVPKLRLEAGYSGSGYQPGIAALHGTEQVSHTFTGYWGAARDRLPASADDPFIPSRPPAVVDFAKDTKGRHVTGQNPDSIVHIRSGQWWARCTVPEREAYEKDLEPVLRKGMAYLETNAPETGDFGLRFMRNIKANRILEVEEAQDAIHGDPDPRRRLETCSAGFFRSLKDLEAWASQHPTHHKIFHGAHAHSTRFGKDAFKMRTWHEVAVLKPGEVSFEYYNCHPRTGLLPFVDW